MENLIFILFICISVPLLMQLPLVSGRSRRNIIFMLSGIFACVFVSQVNGLLLGFCGNDMYFLTTRLAPVSEEIIKMLPVLYFAIVFSDDLQKLAEVSFSVGVGFAVLENMYILVSNYESVDMFWALIRGFSSSLIHGICTITVGLGISLIRKNKRLFFTGVPALLSVAIIYHATYNTLVQSDYSWIAYVLPIITYIPIVVWLIRSKNKNNKETEGGELIEEKK